MTRGGRTKQQNGRERRCIVSGETGDVSGLVRFVVGPGLTVVPDVTGKLPGRGLWVCARRSVLETAIRKNLFSRAAKQAVRTPDDLLQQTQTALALHMIGMVSLARKGGGAVAGFEKVKAAISAATASVLVQASDGSPAQMSKIRQPAGENTLISCLTSRELGLAFGREKVMHAALGAGGLCKRIVEQATKLAGLRTTELIPREGLADGVPEKTSEVNE
ncbi:MAG: RNA-binding protein [Paracoccaceae bacterium]